MKSPLAFALIAGLAATITSTMAHAQIVLNEVYPNPPGSGTIDDRWEYIEIYGPAGMNLTGYLVASVFGGGDPDSDNIPGPLPAGWDGGDEVAEIDEAWSLDGLTIGSNGLLVIYNNAQSSLARPMFAPGTNFATFQVSHCPTTDVGGRVKNDGSATFTLVRKRPFHALNASGVSLYDGVLATTITNGPLTYPSNIRYAWRKDVNPDVDFNGRIDFNGIGSLLLGGNAPAEIGVNSERAATPAVGGPKFLEPYQMVDDIAWSNGGGKEYVRSSQNEISDTAAFNPDAASRVRYLGSNPNAGHVFVAGEMKPSRIADEEFIYGDVLDTGPQSLPLISYNAAPLIGGPTDPNGPTYNILGQLDAQGTYLLNDINLTGFQLTPGNFNDVDSTGVGGINITQFRFVTGDFNFDGVVNCDDKAIIEANLGANLDETATLTDDNNTVDTADDFSYTGWKHQGRDFNALLAMVRMNLADGTTGEWNSGIAVTASDLASFNLLFTGSCCPADLDNGSGTGTQDGGVDINDLLYFLSNFESGSANADLDNDGEPSVGTPDGGVDINDLLFFLSRFESGC
jgi:hypothetical protein